MLLEYLGWLEGQGRLTARTGFARVLSCYDDDHLNHGSNLKARFDFIAHRV